MNKYENISEYIINPTPRPSPLLIALCVKCSYWMFSFWYLIQGMLHSLYVVTTWLGNTKRALLKPSLLVAVSKGWDFFSVTLGEVVWTCHLIRGRFKGALLLTRLGTSLAAFGSPWWGSQCWGQGFPRSSAASYMEFYHTMTLRPLRRCVFLYVFLQTHFFSVEPTPLLPKQFIVISLSS